jgi:hypothetical protein
MAAESEANAEKVAKEAREAIEATKEYTAQQTDAFQRKAQEVLAEFNDKLLNCARKLQTPLNRHGRIFRNRSRSWNRKRKGSEKDWMN